MDGKYSIELFRDGGEGAGIEKILVRHDSLTVARTLYKVAALNCSERLAARGEERGKRDDHTQTRAMGCLGTSTNCPWGTKIKQPSKEEDHVWYSHAGSCFSSGGRRDDRVVVDFGDDLRRTGSQLG